MPTATTATGYQRALDAEPRLEAWLRTSEAYDAFTDELLRRLAAADPANGHGIDRGIDS